MTQFWIAFHRLRYRDVDFIGCFKITHFGVIFCDFWCIERFNRLYFEQVFIHCDTEMSIFRMLSNYSKWVIDDTILDSFSSIAIPRRRFFGCSSITHFKKSASRGFEPTRDFDGLFTGLSRWWIPLRHRRGCGLRGCATRSCRNERSKPEFRPLKDEAASGLGGETAKVAVAGVGDEAAKIALKVFYRLSEAPSS